MVWLWEGTPKFASILEVYRNSIVCLELNEGQLKVGDVLAMKTADKMEPIRFGHIQTIEINRERQERVEGSPGLKIGIGVDFRAKHNCDYFLVPPEIYQEIIA